MPAVKRSWILYAGLLVAFWGVWGAFSNEPNSRYGYPNGMIYIIWSLTMLVPAFFALRGKRFDRRPAAALYGLLAGLTGAGGQLLLFNALSHGPAYLIFPVVSLSPVITVLMAVVLLRERIGRIAVYGLIAALISIVLLSIPAGGGSSAGSGPWLLYAVIIAIAWGAQAYFMRKAAMIGVNDGTTFGWMTISGLLLIPVAWAMMGGFPSNAPWQAPALTAVTQILNATGALFLVMALSRGKATVVSPVTNALAPIVTIILSLAVYRALPSVFGGIGIVLALAGSTLMVYSDEKRGEDGEAVTPGTEGAIPVKHVISDDPLHKSPADKTVSKR
jgi:drug/metabolite transporter (DMT)-like permease